MILFLLLLIYRSVHNIKTSSTIFKIGDFGFESNSTFIIKFSEVKSNNLVFCFFSEAEFAKYISNQILLNHICRNNLNFPQIRFDIQNSQTPFDINGTISNAGIYYRVIANCENSDFLPPQTILSFIEIFRNPSSTLDSRWKGIKKFKTIIFSIYLFALLCWIIKLVCNFSIISNLQILLSFVYVSYLLVYIFRILEINQLEEYDNDNGLTLTRKIIVFVQKFLLYTTILFICKGWCIISSHVSSEIFYYIFLVLIFDVMMLLIDFDTFSSFSTTFLVISVFSSCLVLQKIIMSLHEVRQYLLSKMISVINASDYKIEEINRMRRKYVILEISIIILTLTYISITVSTMFVKISFYLYETVNDSCLSQFLIILMFLFRDSKFDINNGYASVNNSFSLTDLSPLEPNNMIVPPHDIIEEDPTAATAD